MYYGIPKFFLVHLSLNTLWNTFRSMSNWKTFIYPSRYVKVTSHMPRLKNWKENTKLACPILHLFVGIQRQEFWPQIEFNHAMASATLELSMKAWTISTNFCKLCQVCLLLFSTRLLSLRFILMSIFFWP